MLSEFLAHLFGFACIQKNSRDEWIQGEKAVIGLNGSEGELRSVPCIQNRGCYDAHQQTDERGNQDAHEKGEKKHIDEEKNPLRGDLGGTHMIHCSERFQAALAAASDELVWESGQTCASCSEWYHAKNKKTDEKY